MFTKSKCKLSAHSVATPRPVNRDKLETLFFRAAYSNQVVPAEIKQATRSHCHARLKMKLFSSEADDDAVTPIESKCEAPQSRLSL